MKKLLLAGCLVFCAGCKTVFVFSVNKDWVVDGYHNPDLRTKAEVRLERDWKR